MATFYEQFTLNRNSDSLAVTVPNGPELSYREFASVIESFQKQLSTLGLSPQTAISIALPNTLEFATAFIAVTSSSYIAAPLNSNYKQEEFEFYIEDVKARLLLVPQGSVKGGYAAVAAAQKFGAAVAEISWSGSKREVELNLIQKGGFVTLSSVSLPLPPKPSDIAFVLHTSGTTGKPKAVPLLQSNMAATVKNIINTYRLTSADTTYLVMPLFHVHGLLCGFLAPLGSGGAVIIPLKFSAHRFWSDFIKYKANWYTAVPTIHQILLKSPLPSPLPQIRFIRSCSASLAPATFHELEKALRAPVIEAYAMTEACHQMTSNELPPGKRRPGTVGFGQGVEVVILDKDDNVLGTDKEGEVSIRGPNVTPGYLNNDKANAEAFTAKEHYFRTGDQGKLDSEGFLVLTGRIKELIIRGGENISPIELDSAMLTHPAVAEAVAFAAPDSLYGQVVNAAIVLKPGSSATENDIKDFLSAKLAKYKIPQRIFFTKVMPKTATGKIQRRIIAQTFLSQDKAKL